MGGAPWVSHYSLCRVSTPHRRRAGMKHTQVDLDNLRAALVAHLNSVRTILRPRLASWRTQLVSLRARARWQASWRAALPILAFAAAYLVATDAAELIALDVHAPSGPVPTPLFVPGAVIVSAFLLVPPRRWWVYLLTAFPLHLSAHWLLHTPLSIILLSFVANILLGVGTVRLLRHFVPLPLRFGGVREVSLFVACVCGGAVLPACIGAAGRHALLGQAYWPAWQAWYLGDVLANLVFVPAIVLSLAVGSRWLRTAS